MIVPLIASLALAQTQTYLIVRLATGASASTVATRDGLILQDTTPGAPFALYLPRGNASQAQANLQNDKTNVVWVEDDTELKTMEDVAKGGSLSAVGNPSNVQTADLKALSQVGWSSQLAASSGRTVRIAILDTGLSRRQTTLWAQVDAYLDTLGGNGDDKPANLDTNANGVPDEAVGHGTMVAGIVNVVAPKVRVVIAKVADSDGNATSWHTIKGIAFAVNEGAEVANISLGSATQVPALQDVTDWAAGKGLLIVAPIGNGAVKTAWSPAKSSSVLCVAGLNPDNTKASFSNWDSSADACAPAVGIVSEGWNGNLEIWSGTSFASPFVAAGIADCLRRTIIQDPEKTIKAVSDSGTKIDNLNKNYQGNLGTLLNISLIGSKLRSHP